MFRRLVFNVVVRNQNTKRKMRKKTGGRLVKSVPPEKGFF